MVCLQTQTWHHNLFECNCTTNRAPSLAAIPAGVSGARHFSYSTDIFASIIGISLFILFFFLLVSGCSFQYLLMTQFIHIFFFFGSSLGMISLIYLLRAWVRVLASHYNRGSRFLNVYIYIYAYWNSYVSPLPLYMTPTRSLPTMRSSLSASHCE